MMDVDHDSDVQSRGGELKIKGQAEAGKRKSQWDEEDHDEPMPDKSDLAKRESELKEKALRNKVVRTRKLSSGGGVGSSQ